MIAIKEIEDQKNKKISPFKKLANLLGDIQYDAKAEEDAENYCKNP